MLGCGPDIFHKICEVFMITEIKSAPSEIARRFLVFALGLVFMGFGVACLIKSTLGVSPISSLPYTFSLLVPSITVGGWTALLNLIMIILQPVLKKGIAKKTLLLQCGMTIVFGYFIDLSLECMANLSLEHYSLKVAMLLAGCSIMAFGTYFGIIARVTLLPMDALLQVVAEKIDRRYTSVRVISDLCMTATAAVLCLIFLGELKAVREGTLITAFLCGTEIRFFTSQLKGLTYLLLPENLIQKEKQAVPAVSEHHFVLTVSHEYGSGGRTIAKRIAHELNLPYYDTEIIKMASERSDFAAEYLREHEEKITSTALYTLFDWYTGSFPQDELPVPEQIFRLEAQVIQEIAAKDSCVIVGRLANYILQNHRNSLHIFITADETERIERVMRKESILKEEAVERIRSFAAERRNHCRQFSDMEWGNGMNYDITVKSNRYGVDRTAAILIQLIREFRLIQF